MRRVLALVSCAALVASLALAADPPATTPTPKGLHYLYLIRHGAYDRDTVQTDDRIGSGLNALGHVQARLVGKRLAALPVKYHALITSDFTRARETADEIGRILHMTPVRDSLIHECTPTTERADIMKDETPQTLAACESNLNAAWARYAVPTPDLDQIDILVAHGNVIRWMVTRALGAPLDHWLRMDIGNCSLSILAIKPDGTARLVQFSDDAHIPLVKQTWSGSAGGWLKKPAGKAKGMR
jgi:serine/threonine-protein phosphatase PGAM5